MSTEHHPSPTDVARLFGRATPDANDDDSDENAVRVFVAALFRTNEDD